MAGGSPAVPASTAFRFVRRSRRHGSSTAGVASARPRHPHGLVFGRSDSERYSPSRRETAHRCGSSRPCVRVRCSPAVVRRMVYSGRRRHFYALNAADGTRGVDVRVRPGRSRRRRRSSGASSSSARTITTPTPLTGEPAGNCGFPLELPSASRPAGVTAIRCSRPVVDLDAAAGHRHPGKTQWRSSLDVHLRPSPSRVAGSMPARRTGSSDRPATGNRLAIFEASYGYGGMALARNLLFTPGIQGQYGTPGMRDGPSIGGQGVRQAGATMEDVRPVEPRRNSAGNWARWARPLVIGDLLCAAPHPRAKPRDANPDGTRSWTAQLGGALSLRASGRRRAARSSGCRRRPVYGLPREGRGK